MVAQPLRNASNHHKQVQAILPHQSSEPPIATSLAASIPKQHSSKTAAAMLSAHDDKPRANVVVGLGEPGPRLPESGASNTNVALVPPVARATYPEQRSIRPTAAILNPPYVQQLSSTKLPSRQHGDARPLGTGRGSSRFVKASVCAIVFATSSVEPDAISSATCTRAATEHERGRELQESRHFERIGGSTATYTPIGIDSPTRQREAIAIGSSVTTDGPRVPASALHPLPACKATQSYTGRALRRMLGLGPRRRQAGKVDRRLNSKEKENYFSECKHCGVLAALASRSSSTRNLDRSKPRSQSTGHHSVEPGPRRFEATANSLHQWDQLNLRYQSTCLGAGASKLAQQVSASTQTATIQTSCKRTQTETSQIILPYTLQSS